MTYKRHVNPDGWNVLVRLRVKVKLSARFRSVIWPRFSYRSRFRYASKIIVLPCVPWRGMLIFTSSGDGTAAAPQCFIVESVYYDEDDGSYLQLTLEDDVIDLSGADDPDDELRWLRDDCGWDLGESPP